MTTPANWQPAPPPPKRSIVRPMAMTLVSSFLLGLGSCFGFLSTLNFNGPSKPVNTLFMIGSFYAACSPEARNSDFTRAFGWALGPALLLGVLAALFGTVWLIMALLLHVFYFLKTKSRD